MRRQFLIALAFVFILSLSGIVLAANPNGAIVTEINTSTYGTTNPTSSNATAGNVTELVLTATVSTQTWQGYYGNISGVIQLANSASNVMYNWTLASPQGEVYASTSNAVTWSSIGCFNFTANGTYLEGSYNISAGDSDGVNETFSYANGHDVFSTAAVSFTGGQCMSTKIFNNSGQGVDNQFEEVLLWDGNNPVFASLLEQDILGFDSRTHDFEMLVLEDGHGANTASVPYYFYVELN